MLGEEAASCVDDEGFGGDVVAGLTEVNRVVCVQELVVHDIGVRGRELGNGEVGSQLEGSVWTAELHTHSESLCVPE